VRCHRPLIPRSDRSCGRGRRPGGRLLVPVSFSRRGGLEVLADGSSVRRPCRPRARGPV
jgi:hypothetical protein